MKKIIILNVVTMLVTLLSPSQFVAAGQTNKPLTQKQVLGALIKNADVKLKDGAHCQGVGVEQTDQTIGDYLSGFWAFHANTQGQNWLDISTSQTGKSYLAKVMIYRKDGEENWGWGVSFEMDGSGKVNRKSFTCLGGG